MKLSIIMSIYNETSSEIDESVKSLLLQSFTDFELIIIVDKVNRKTELKMNEILTSDNRIRMLFNEKNMGLALSMNRAASIAKGKYLVRMDADDICVTNRLEKQLQLMEEKNLDLCCTNYDYIDENSKLIKKKRRIYNNSSLIEQLPYFNTIHHPTVMMKKSFFKEIGGYRDFPCSQDYDLWLRMYDAGAKMEIIDIPLLYYRIRSNSISISRYYQQLATVWYIQDLYRSRKKNKDNVDFYSLENYNKYLNKIGCLDEKFIKKNDKLCKTVTNIQNMPYLSIKRWLLIFYLIIRSTFYRRLYIRNGRNFLFLKLKC